ncbi:hypothetical protein OAQ84_01695 [Bdellovibrionales bacterium]|nr:hypothetical protein [Bdellovibrionales bacterium]
MTGLKKLSSLYKSPARLATLLALLGATLFFQNCERAEYDEFDGSSVALGAYFWRYSDFQSCTAQCEGGTQRREVWCSDTNSAIVDSSNCTGIQPPSEQSCNNHGCSSSREVTQTVKLIGANYQLDVFLVVDDSSSMITEQKKLASRLDDFVAKLSNSKIDWQMCITTTDVDYYEGDPLKWSGTNTHKLTPTTSGNLSQIFTSTIDAIGAGYSSDEQGIRATILAMRSNGSHNCFRDGAALSVVLLSDEDERSVGGNIRLSSAQYKPIESDNLPETLFKEKDRIFGADKRFTFNSIIVRPGDRECEEQQDAQASPSFEGRFYAKASGLSKGGVASICASDYSSHINYFSNVILSSLSEVTLECPPKAGTLTVATTPEVPGLNFSQDGLELTFQPALSAGTTVTLRYRCNQ